MDSSVKHLQLIKQLLHNKVTLLNHAKITFTFFSVLVWVKNTQLRLIIH